MQTESCSQNIQLSLQAPSCHLQHIIMGLAVATLLLPKGRGTDNRGGCPWSHPPLVGPPRNVLPVSECNAAFGLCNSLLHRSIPFSSRCVNGKDELCWASKLTENWVIHKTNTCNIYIQSITPDDSQPNTRVTSAEMFCIFKEIDTKSLFVVLYLCLSFHTCKVSVDVASYLMMSNVLEDLPFILSSRRCFRRIEQLLSWLMTKLKEALLHTLLQVNAFVWTASWS